MPKKKDPVAKALVRNGAYYVFSKKKPRSGDPKKARRLELLGGGFRRKQDPFLGLLIELVAEEPTGIIALCALKQLPVHEKVVVDKEDHYIFEINIGPGSIDHLEHGEDESYGFKRVKCRVIHNKAMLRRRLLEFTPKTQRIFKKARCV